MDKRALLENVDWNTVLRYLLGGALMGGGAAATTSLVNHMNSLGRKQKALKNTGFDDDTLFVNLPQQKLASMGGTTFAASTLASLLGGMGAYNFVRNYYLKKRQEQAQRELDDAQNLYLGQLTQGQQLKQAGFSLVDKGTGSIGALMLLLGLGSAAATNAVLSNYFPAYQQSKPTRPRRVVIRRQPTTGMEKEAPVGPSEITQQEIEALMRTKTASGTHSVLSGVLSAVSQGRLDDVKEMIKSSGMEETLRLLNGAEKVASDRFTRDVAVSVVAGDPFLSNAVLPYVAMESSELMPSFCKVASTPELAPYLTELRGMAEAAGELGRQAFWEPVAEQVLKQAGLKEAKGMHPVAEAALPQKALMGLLFLDYMGRTSEEDQKHDEGSTLNGSVSDESDPATLTAASSDAQGFVNKHPELANVLLTEVNKAA